MTAVEPVLLSLLVDKLTGFRQVPALNMIHNLFLSYGTIEKICLEENTVNTMSPYNLTKPLDRLIEQLEKGR